MQINLFGDIIQEEAAVAVEEKTSPFTYMTSISNKKYPTDFDGYVYDLCLRRQPQLL